MGRPTCSVADAAREHRHAGVRFYGCAARLRVTEKGRGVPATCLIEPNVAQKCSEFLTF